MQLAQLVLPKLSHGTILGAGLPEAAMKTQKVSALERGA
jgi:hypothetical protein